MRLLAVESSCDDTAAAVLEDGAVRSSVVASQDDVHGEYGGVVPELASRQHLRDIRPVVEEALSRAGTGYSGLSGLAVTSGPGLVGPLLVGVSFAKSLALATGLPLAGVHHLAGHVRAAFLREKDEELVPGSPSEEPAGPYLALVVSGGHTSLFRIVRDASGNLRHHEELARTLDDAAGEAYDKCGKLLGLGYPAGPRIDTTDRSCATTMSSTPPGSRTAQR